jgi:hypothetical protein
VAIPACTRLAKVPVRLTHEGPPGVNSYPRTAPHLCAPPSTCLDIAQRGSTHLDSHGDAPRSPSAATSSEPSRSTTPRQFPQHVAGWLIHIEFPDLCAVRHQATQRCNHCRYRETARWPGTCLSPSTDVTGDRLGMLRSLSGTDGDRVGTVEAGDSAGTGILLPKDTVTSLPSAGIDKSSSSSA